jgi:hypothetical protein
MYAKKIKFTDFNGNEREQTFYFNLTKAELTEMQLSHDGGLAEYMQRIIDSQKTSEIAEVFKKLILMSYGEKSDDGMRFIKRDPVRGKLADEFEQTDAYSELFMELAQDDKAATEFMNNVIPASIQKEVAAQQTGGNAYPPQIAKK